MKIKKGMAAVENNGNSNQLKTFNKIKNLQTLLKKDSAFKQLCKRKIF